VFLGYKMHIFIINKFLSLILIWNTLSAKLHSPKSNDVENWTPSQTLAFGLSLLVRSLDTSELS
jgi:hypothetical protein